MDMHEILPPGAHPVDPARLDVDPIGYALERLQTMLVWIEEHRSSFEKLQNTDPILAETELSHLQNVTEQAMLHLQRLKELLLAGYSIDHNKQMPKGLFSTDWLRLTESLLQKQCNKST